MNHLPTLTELLEPRAGNPSPFMMFFACARVAAIALAVRKK